MTGFLVLPAACTRASSAIEGEALVGVDEPEPPPILRTPVKSSRSYSGFPEAEAAVLMPEAPTDALPGVAAYPALPVVVWADMEKFRVARSSSGEEWA